MYPPFHSNPPLLPSSPPPLDPPRDCADAYKKKNSYGNDYTKSGEFLISPDPENPSIKPFMVRCDFDLIPGQGKFPFFSLLFVFESLVVGSFRTQNYNFGLSTKNYELTNRKTLTHRWWFHYSLTFLILRMFDIII